MSSVTSLLPCKVSGTSPLTIRWANASAIAVFPTPGSPIRTGLFLVLRLSICITLCSSMPLPTTGSNLPDLAALVRSIPS